MNYTKVFLMSLAVLTLSGCQLQPTYVEIVPDGSQQSEYDYEVDKHKPRTSNNSVDPNTALPKAVSVEKFECNLPGNHGAQTWVKNNTNEPVNTLIRIALYDSEGALYYDTWDEGRIGSGETRKFDTYLDWGFLVAGTECELAEISNFFDDNYD